MPPDEVTTRPVGGRYELRELLGRGGMGSVWRGEDLLLQRPVAVKRVELPLHLPEAEREALRQRVRREARAAARVSRPRLVTIFDVVEDAGTVFLVQELVDAPTMKDAVASRGPLAPAEVARIGKQLAEGLAAAHANGVVHRDVKPSNVMIGDDGSVKLADFGVASVHGDPQLTATGVIIGSPAYMAPEQATGAKVTGAADVWSLGATLYFAVEGEPPFGRADTLSTLTAVVHDPPRPTERAGVLAPVIDRLLAKDPEARPGLAEVIRLLDADADADADRTVVATTAAPAPRPTEVRAPVAAPAADPPGPRPRPRPLGPIIALVVLLLAGGLALAAVLGERDRDREDASEDAPAAQDTATTEATTATTAATDTAPSTTEPAEAATTTAVPDAPVAAQVPAGWTTYTDDETGYTVAHPGGWRVQHRSGNRTDFTDPATGTYLRVDWTDAPGPSAQADWERQSTSFGDDHDDYREIRIEPTRFAGSDNAALWEYRYRAGDTQLHAYNLGFVLPGRDYGFALNFQTHEDRWAGSQGLWEQLKAGFAPPS